MDARKAWLKTLDAWLKTPGLAGDPTEAWLETPEAWLRTPEAWLEIPKAWLETPKAPWLNSFGLARGP